MSGESQLETSPAVDLLVEIDPVESAEGLPSNNPINGTGGGNGGGGNGGTRAE